MKFYHFPYFRETAERERLRADVRFSLSSFTFHIGFLPHGQRAVSGRQTTLRENKDYDDWCDDDDDDCLSSMRVFVAVLDEREKREEKW